MEYDDGTQYYYFANVIDEKLYSKVDSKGDQFLILEEIFDNCSDRTAIHVDDGFIISQYGNKHPKKKRVGGSYSPKLKKGFQSRCH